MAWDINVTDEFARWYDALDDADAAAVNAAIDMLEERGPALPRPFADSIQGSRLHNLKELRPRPGNLRVLFIFDPWRSAILLVGGDKTNQWGEWYKRAIPAAERLYDEYLEERRRERGEAS
jgi:hypothetical protein